MANDINILINKIYKKFCVVVWGRNDYLLEAKMQLSDANVTEMLVTLKIFSVSYRKLIIKLLAVLKRGVFLQRTLLASLKS